MDSRYDYDAEYERAMMIPATGPMEVVYFISKPGEARKFATSTPPAPHWALSLKAEGYRILRITFPLPRGWDSADAAITTTRHEQVEDVTDQLATDELAPPFASTPPPKGDG